MPLRRYVRDTDALLVGPGMATLPSVGSLARELLVEVPALISR